MQWARQAHGSLSMTKPMSSTQLADLRGCSAQCFSTRTIILGTRYHTSVACFQCIGEGLGQPCITNCSSDQDGRLLYHNLRCRNHVGWVIPQTTLGNDPSLDQRLARNRACSRVALAQPRTLCCFTLANSATTSSIPDAGRLRVEKFSPGIVIYQPVTADAKPTPRTTCCWNR